MPGSRRLYTKAHGLIKTLVVNRHCSPLKKNARFWGMCDPSCMGALQEKATFLRLT